MKDYREELTCTLEDPCSYDHTCKNHRYLADMKSDYLAEHEQAMKEKDEQIAALTAVAREEIAAQKAELDAWHSVFAKAKATFDAVLHDYSCHMDGDSGI